MRTAGALSYLLTDHLGSTAVTTDAAGAKTGELRYLPFGATRTTWGVIPTDRRFTGQPRYATLGLDYFGARWYDPALGRFISADTIVPEPGNPQALNRYSYTLNNPLKYRDPSGHWIETAWDIANIAWDIAEVRSDPSLLNWGALVVDVAAVAIPAVPGGAGLIARGGKAAKAAIKVAGHGDEAVDAVRLVGKAADASAGLRRFQEVGTEIVPDLLKAYGDGGRALGELPDAVKGRRVTTLGRGTDTAAAKELGERILDLPEPHSPLQWSLEVNHEWLQTSIKNGDVFYLASPVNSANLLTDQRKYGAVTVFARELDALLQAGYRRVGDYLIPPR